MTAQNLTQPPEPASPAIPNPFTRKTVFLVLWSSLDGQRRLATLHPTASLATAVDGIESIMERQLRDHQQAVVSEGATLQDYLQGSPLTHNADLLNFRQTCLRPIYSYEPDGTGSVNAIELELTDSAKTIADRALKILLEPRIKALNQGDMVYEATDREHILLLGFADKGRLQRLPLTPRYGQLFMKKLRPKT